MTADEKPIVYIFRGDDREEIEAQVSDFINRMGSPDMAKMNTTRLEGKPTTLNDLRAAALALPFLTERRLVIVEDALQPYTGRGKQADREAFTDLLDSLPTSTALVLIVPDFRKYKRNAYEWDVLNKQHWLIQWAAKAGTRALVKDCPLPTEADMVSWVRQKAAEAGGSFSPKAAQTLAEYVGNNTQRAAQEIEKLLTYVNFERPVDDQDVRELTFNDQQADMFDMVDAIGNRDGQKAIEKLHILLEQNDLLNIFGMIVRQFRLLLQTREILTAGGKEADVAKILKQHPFVAKKITGQAQKFTLATLESIYQQLLAIDVAGKTSAMDVDLGLDVLIAELASS